MLTLLIIFAVAALFTLIASAMGKCPLWVPVLCLTVFALLEVLPIGATHR